MPIEFDAGTGTVNASLSVPQGELANLEVTCVALQAAQVEYSVNVDVITGTSSFFFSGEERNPSA
jgi:hypothetical protein